MEAYRSKKIPGNGEESLPVTQKDSGLFLYCDLVGYDSSGGAIATGSNDVVIKDTIFAFPFINAFIATAFKLLDPGNNKIIGSLDQFLRWYFQKISFAYIGSAAGVH